jgi:acyl carrier protein
MQRSLPITASATVTVADAFCSPSSACFRSRRSYEKDRGWQIENREWKGKPTMSEAEIRQIVKQALSNVAPEVDLNSIDPQKDLRDQIDIDSVDFLNFVIGLHKQLNVEIPDADVGKLVTLNGCVAYLTGKASGA